MSIFKSRNFILCDRRLRLLSSTKKGIKVRAFQWYVELLTRREEWRGSKLHICYTPFERHYAWMDETLVYCLMTIIISVPLETSFCSASILFKLKERIIFTCLVLKWCSETRYEMDETDNQWRQPLKSWSPTFISPACLWATAHMNNLFLWFDRPALHSEGTQEVLLVFTWNIHCIWEVTLPGCNVFLISKKPVYLVIFQKKFKNKHVYICIKPNPGTKHKNLLQMSLITLLAAFSETIPGLVPYDVTALWTLIHHCGRYSFSVLKWISLQACLRLFCFKLL